MSLDELTAKLENSDAKIAELSALNAEFEKENLTLSAKVTELEKGGEQFATRIAALEKDASDTSQKHAAEVAKINSELETAKAELSESKKENALLREQGARYGASAPKKAAQKENEKPTMSLGEFNSLPICERNKFMREGGKLAA